MFNEREPEREREPESESPEWRNNEWTNDVVNELVTDSPTVSDRSRKTGMTLSYKVTNGTT